MNKSFAIPILFFLALVITVYFILPIFYDFNNSKKELGIREKELSAVGNYYQEIHDSFDKLKKHQETLEKIDSALPAEPFIPSLLHFLQKASTENGMFLKSVNLATPPPAKQGEEEEELPEKIQEKYINVELMGSYDSFKDFLKSIEKSSRLIEVEDIVVNVEEEKLPTFDLSLKVYSY